MAVCRAIPSQYFGRYTLATAQVDDRPWSLILNSSDQSWDDPPVCPLLASIDRSELVVAHSGVRPRTDIGIVCAKVHTLLLEPPLGQHSLLHKLRQTPPRTTSWRSFIFGHRQEAPTVGNRRVVVCLSALQVSLYCFGYSEQFIAF
jgi:hypothetical protein